jgi:hypothetical protein
VRRAALPTAILAALLWTPSAVLAAPPNQLAEPHASPTHGTLLTPFHLSVRYISTGGNPALGVTAEVGPLDIPLHLASGTPLDGTWSVSSLLPVGSWPLHFRATVVQGPTPSLAGPSILVAGEDPASHAPSALPAADEPQPTSTGAANADDPTPGPAESPAAKPDATSKPVAGTDKPEPAPPPARRGRGGSETAEPAPRRSDGGERQGRRRGDRPVGSPTIVALPGGGEAPVDGGTEESGRGDLLLVLAGIVGVATVGLLGTGWMLASREREDEAPAGASAGGAGPTPPHSPRDGRRAASRQAAHDPVLAAMGLEDPDDGATGPSRGAARGVAPRPKRGPRARR